MRIPLEVKIDELPQEPQDVLTNSGAWPVSPSPRYRVRATMLDTDAEQVTSYEFHSMLDITREPYASVGRVAQTSLRSFESTLRRLRDELDDVLEGARVDLRDQKALALALELLDSKELGAVIALSLGRLDEAGNTPLPELLRRLADNVEREEERRRDERSD